MKYYLAGHSLLKIQNKCCEKEVEKRNNAITVLLLSANSNANSESYQTTKLKPFGKKSTVQVSANLLVILIYV